MKLIPLSQGKFALVDDDLFEELSQWKWSFHLPDYAARVVTKNKVRRTIKMHRLIIGAKKGQDVDHIDGNGLNNQRANLRIVNDTLNQRNRRLTKTSKSGFKGVSWDKRSGRWIVQIRINKRTKFLGYFTDKVKGAMAYNEAAKKYFGEYARINPLT